MASRPGPCAARRLLQPTQPASTTAGSPEPRPGASLHQARLAPHAGSSHGALGGCQPRFHGSGTGLLAHPAPLAPGRPCGRPGESFTPTRSARAPLVMRPLRRRLETPTSRGAALVREQRLDDLTPRAPPPRRAGARGAPRRRLRGRRGGQGRFTRSSAKKSGIRRCPRCLPSMSRSPSSARPKSRVLAVGHGGRAPRPRDGANPSRDRGNHGCPQPVANLWARSDAFGDLGGSRCL